MSVRTFSLCALLALTAACGSESAAPSPEQDRELNTAAEMLNKAPDSLDNVNDEGLLAEEQPDGAASEP